jgi:hypothetical protein
MLGYPNSSFLSSMTGNNYSREVTEKTARKFEGKLGLRHRELDELPFVSPLSVDSPGSGRTQLDIDVSFIKDTIILVGSICTDEDVQLPVLKFAEVAALSLQDATEHGNKVRPDYVKQLVRLLKA